MTLVAVIVLGTGILLVYSAVKNKHPVEVVKEALGGGPAGPLGTILIASGEVRSGVQEFGARKPASQQSQASGRAVP